jgi:enamine deaminase RidA (YjgF/YER057c/UK114 family)
MPHATRREIVEPFDEACACPFAANALPHENLDNDLCQAVVTQGGRIVWLRGQCPQNLDDAVSIDSHDPVEQTHKVMQNIRQLIEEAGGRMEHLVKIVVYLTDAIFEPPSRFTSFDHLVGARDVAGTSRPSALAVLRLITSSYLIGACTGRSVGFAPFSMRSMYSAALAYWSNTSLP